MSHDGGFIEIADEVNGTTFRDEGLLSETIYYYRVCSFNAFGNSKYSNISQATTKNCNRLEEAYFTSCEEMMDTCGLKLYPFIPFTDEWNRANTPYAELLESRQIPEDFMRNMTTEELFYQVVYCDLARNMLSTERPEMRLNMVPELLNRPDLGKVLLVLFQRNDPSILETDCVFWRFCLQLFGAQPVFINSLTEDEIFIYVHHQLRLLIFVQNNCQIPYYQCDMGLFTNLILYGLGNLMILYEYEPFMQTLERNPVTNEIIWEIRMSDLELNSLKITNYVEQFLKLV